METADESYRSTSNAEFWASRNESWNRSNRPAQGVHEIGTIVSRSAVESPHEEDHENPNIILGSD